MSGLTSAGLLSKPGLGVTPEYICLYASDCWLLAV
jgi:hypothetical protein